MDAINPLPITTPVAAAQGPRPEAASEQAGEGSSFEDLLGKKSAPAGDQAVVESEVPGPEDPAKSADETFVPDGANLSTLLAMFPVLPTLPLQPEPIALAAGTETGVPETAAAFEPAGLSPGTTPVHLFRRLAGEGATASDSNPQAPLVTAFPRAATVAIPPARASQAPATESFAKAAPMPDPAAATVGMVALVTTVQLPRKARGTDVAMSERVMPDPLKSIAPEPRTAALPADAGASEMVASVDAPRAEIRMPASAGQQHSAGEHREEQSGFPPQASDVPAPTTTPVNSFVAPTASAAEPAAASAAASAAEPAATVRTQAETIIHRTIDAAERLRVTGGERVEVQIKLDAGPALTIRLQLVHGEVKPIFLTDSHELRQALEQNWSQFSERGADRNVRVTTPVFESPSSQSGMNDLNQQQREGRQRAFADAQEAAFAGANPTRRTLPRRTSAVAPAAAPATGVQLYA